MAAKTVTIALTGNPNAGKTTIFNNFTGARQHVGNWPGVTVERKEGSCRFRGYEIKVVDLPGTYSLTAYSLDEVVARSFIVDEHPDVVVDIVDASNLERNLYLTMQLLEMETKVVVALNMVDVALSRGYHINVAELSRLLGIPVIKMVASRSQGTDELLATIIDVAEGRIKAGGLKFNYGREIEEEIAKLEKIIVATPVAGRYSPRWLAVKLLEGDDEILKKIEG